MQIFKIRKFLEENCQTVCRCVLVNILSFLYIKFWSILIINLKNIPRATIAYANGLIYLSNSEYKRSFFLRLSKNLKKHIFFIIFSLQMRSANEGQTTFYRCLKELSLYVTLFTSLSTL